MLTRRAAPGCLSSMCSCSSSGVEQRTGVLEVDHEPALQAAATWRRGCFTIARRPRTLTRRAAPGRLDRVCPCSWSGLQAGQWWN